MALDIIKDPVTGKQYSRDTSITGSTYAPYNPMQTTQPASQTTQTTQSASAQPSNWTPGQALPQGYQLDPTGTKLVPNVNPFSVPGGTFVNAPQTPTQTSVTNPMATPSSSSSGISPNLPQPTATDTFGQFHSSVASNLDNLKTQLNNQYQSQIDYYATQAKQAQANIDQLNANQANTLDQIQQLSAPFRAQMESSMENQLYVTQNFQENQKLVNELDSLLQQGNDLITQQKQQPIATAVLNKMVNQTMSDVAARAGVIQAVISARNGQIAQAYTMIDRAVQATTADRTDQINYYKELLNFQQTQKDEQGKNLVSFTSQEQKYMDAQINSLQAQVDSAQKNADAIKNAMTDPNTAFAYAQAGVTLNDSPAQINTKLATYGYQQEKIKLSNDMASKGYSYLVPGQQAPAGSDVVTTTDSKGKTTQYYKAKTGGGTTLTSTNQRALIGAGLSTQDIQNIESDIQKYGIDAVLQNITDPAQKQAIEKAYGVPNQTSDIYLTNTQMNSVASQMISTYGSAQDAINALQTTGKISSTDSSGTAKEYKLNKDQIDQLIKTIQNLPTDNTQAGNTQQGSSWWQNVLNYVIPGTQIFNK